MPAPRISRPVTSRRSLIRIGSLGLPLAGLTAAERYSVAIPDLLHAADSGRLTTGRAKRCLLFFLEGGPAQMDLWDMKPEAPEIVRGPFQPIATRVPGLQICEHLPLLAQSIHRMALIRSVHHTVVDHNAGAYYALTGRSPVAGGQLIVRDQPENHPSMGSVVAKLRPTPTMPEFVHVPEIMFNNGDEIPGERAGFLGPAFDPLVSGDPSVTGYRVPGLVTPDGISADRLTARRQLLDQLDRHAGSTGLESQVAALDAHYEKAFSLITSPAARQAFRVDDEPARIRDRYGLPDRVDRSVEARKFGGLPHLGQSLLLCRRLLEAGVQLITCCTGRRTDQTWDGHRDHFSLLRKSILPYFDRALSAFLDDLDDRGMLDDTLVVVMGEFGRTPKIGQITSNAGATDEGRDHWPHCYTVLMAGAGIAPGAIYGASDREAAFPASKPVTPEDIAATIFHALGLPPEIQINDQFQRPHALSSGNVLSELFS